MAKKPMTKAQVVSHFAEKFEISKKTAASVIDEMAALAIAETKKTGSLPFRESANPFFQKESTTGRNPATGEEIKIPARPW